MKWREWKTYFFIVGFGVAGIAYGLQGNVAAAVAVLMILIYIHGEELSEEVETEQKLLISRLEETLKRLRWRIMELEAGQPDDHRLYDIPAAPERKGTTVKFTAEEGYCYNDDLK